uniref:Uncharacterized protein n=1 Tax=Nelumbo nucifera TaxID=4432 RepID=A0A822ZMA3_NELNU|nr:TPA_asm: hypothetical protein HUJ06_004113 [Nelumbo nucifera]
MTKWRKRENGVKRGRRRRKGKKEEESREIREKRRGRRKVGCHRYSGTACWGLS